MRIISYIILLGIILLGVSFATLNSNVVGINYYIGHGAAPLSLLLAATFAIGCLVGILVCIGLLLKVKVKNYRLGQKLKLVQKEVDNLRAIPLQDKH